MKKTLVSLLALSLSSLAFAAPAKIGVLLKDKTPGFWVYAERGATEAAAKLGVSASIKAPIAVTDVGAQSRLLTIIATENPAALVIAPTNPETIEPQIKALAAKGVKIVAVDTPLKEGLAQVFVGADHQAMSNAATEIFMSLVKDGDEIAVLRNNSVDRPVLIRERTVLDAIKARGKVVLHADIYASTEKDSEEERALLLLEKYPQTKVIFASATRGTLATIKAVRAKGLVGKVKVVGFGTYLPPEVASAFADGILFGWIAQQPKELGSKGVEAAAALIAGQSVPAELHPDFAVVTPLNFRDPKIQALSNP